MEFKLSFNVNDAIYLKNPEGTELGKRIMKESIDLINEIGFEDFNFRKLALEVGTTEATIYRYFENKHRMLLYIISWYWFYIDFLLDYNLKNIASPAQKLREIIRLLTHELPESTSGIDYNKKYLNNIVIAESSKVYLTKEVAEINEHEVFKPYKDLCARIASVINDCNKKYAYAKSLSTTIIETAHQQQFFSAYLPRLTDATEKNRKDFTNNFLDDLVFKVIS